MVHDPDISLVAGLFADESRLAILFALAEGSACAASELAQRAGISAQTASAHLARLEGAGLVRVTARGRYRYYQLASDQVGAAVESLAALAPAAPALTTTQTTAAGALRFARTCYGHLAGAVGVAVADALRSRGYLEDFSSGWALTRAGNAWFTRLGIDFESIRSPRAPLLRTCLDWSERRFHLGGALGRAFAGHCFSMGWIGRMRQTRAVRLTGRGRAALREQLGVTLAEPAAMVRPSLSSIAASYARQNAALRSAIR